MQLDPRTVSRRYILERADFKRPDLSVVVPTADATSRFLDRLDALGRNQGLTVQIIRSGNPGTDDETVASGDRAGRSRERALSVLCVAPVMEAPPVAAVNRAVAAAIGRVFLLGDASSEAITRLSDRFSSEPDLGVVSTGRPCRQGIFRSGLAVRGDLWMALGGLDDAFGSIDWALRDFLLRARAIGFATPRRIERVEASRPGIAIAGDRHLIRRHARLAPDRSGARTRDRETSIAPGQLAIYTAITDRYDMLKPQLPSAVGGSRLVALLDDATARQHDERMRGWQAASVQFPDVGARRASRYFKANAHLALPESPYSLWIDASVSLVAPISAARLAEMFLSDSDICVFRHHARHSIYEEAETCKVLGLDAPETVDRQVDRYRREGLPQDTGLAELPIILRRHSKAMEEFNEAWWAEIASGSWRDQLSFNYVVWKTGLRYATFPLSLVVQNGLFVKFRR